MKDRKLSKKEERRNRILEAAALVLHEKGAAGTTLDEIADRAGVVRRTVYNHFPSKDELFCAMIEPMRTRLLDRLDAFKTELDTAETVSEDPLGRLCGFLFSIWHENARDIELFSERSLSSYITLHGEFEDFRRHFGAFFSRPEVASELRLAPETSAHLAFSTIISIGRVFEGRPDEKEQFSAAMRGLLAGQA